MSESTVEIYERSAAAGLGHANGRRARIYSKLDRSGHLRAIVFTLAMKSTLP